MNESEESDICKVCRCPGEDGNPLFYPCDCKGSIRFVHQDCLVQWLKHSNSQKCELCRKQYKFVPVYSQDAPSVLSFSDLLIGISRRFWNNFIYILRFVIVIIGWAVIVPLEASMLWNTYIPSSSDPWTIKGILGNIFFGSFLFGTILLSLIGIMSLTSYIRNLRLLDDSPGGVLGFGDELFGFLDPVIEEDPEDDDDLPSFEEILGLKGSISTFFKYVFSIMIANTMIILLVILSPRIAGYFVRRIGFLNDYLEQFSSESSIDDLKLTSIAGMIGVLVVSFSLVHLLKLMSKLRELSLFEKQVATFILFFYTCFKVFFLSVCELVFFPIFAGVVIDYCSLSLFSTSFKERLITLNNFPVSFLLLHWVIGFFFMFYFGYFVRQLKKIIRPGLLWFLRDPESHDFHPLRDMIKLPIAHHHRRFGLSALLYANLIFATVGAPIIVLQYLFPSITSNTAHKMESPFELILLHVILPFSVQFFKPKKTFAIILSIWLVVVAHILGITEYIFGQANNNENNNNNNNDNNNNINNNNDNNNQVVENEGDNHNNIDQVENDGDNHNNIDQVENDGEEEQEVEEEEEEEEVVDDQDVGDIDIIEVGEPYNKPSHFPLRVTALLIISWISTVTFVVLFVTIPTLFGNILSKLFVNDLSYLHSFIIGFYLLWCVVHPWIYIMITWTTTNNPINSQFFKKMLSWCWVCTKIVIVATLWIGVIPFLLGELIILTVITPLRLHPFQTRSSSLYFVCN
eukprot:TRINITY_DN4538_c0_g1_i3.p1 TRINITY_DN4538_c0_g1~~TRINITY_DN4538_c0_g1_i3.p1  ORF type:complete len:756 (+),score=108.24 TRINITY_DN4538_c0_g1_i3:39-2270(+)